MVGDCDVLVAASGCAVSRGQETVGAYVDDTGITSLVKARFFEDKDVAGSSISVETLKGTVMLSGFAKSALERNKVVEIAPAAGTKFDPHHHQAISVVPAAQEPNTVVTVLQKGYSIADRVLRPALVTVTAPK